MLKSSNVLELLVPILYHLNLCRSDPAKTGLMHIGFFILLMLSGERNFGKTCMYCGQLQQSGAYCLSQALEADLASDV